MVTAPYSLTCNTSGPSATRKLLAVAPLTQPHGRSVTSRKATHYLIFFPINNTRGAGESQYMCHKGGSVFVELMPLLAGRTVLITVAKVDDPASRDSASTSFPPLQRPARTRLSVHRLKPPAVPTARRSSKQRKGGANPFTVSSGISAESMRGIKPLFPHGESHYGESH